MLHFTSTILISACLAGAAVPEVTDTLRESVVTGTRVSMVRDLIPVPVSTVGRRELDESDAVTIFPALMEQVPGLFITTRGTSGYGVSGGAAGGISLRGLGAGSGRVLILIDGHPQFESIYGHPVADEYLSVNVQGVEVSRGSSSVLYGSNAMGGAINIITRRPVKEGNSMDLKLTGGSYGTFRATVSDSYRKGRFNANVSGSYDRTDGHRENSAFNSKGAYARLGYDISGNWTANSNFSIMNAFSMNPGSVDAPMTDGTADVTRAMAALSIDNDYGCTKGSVSLFYSRGSHIINDGYTPGGTPQPYLFHGTDYMGGATIWQAARIFEGNMLTGGFDLKLYGGNAYRNPETEIYADHINLHEYAVYLFDQQEAGRFSLNAGIRLESHKLYGLIAVPQAGVSFKAGRNTVLKASASKGFRTPNMRELYMYAVANEDLLPEEAWTFDLSMSQKAFGDRLRAEISLFHIRGSNMIEVVAVDGRMQNHNTGAFANYGAELALTGRISENFSAECNYSYLYMDKPVTGAPEHKGYLGARWNSGRFSARLGMTGIAGLYLLTGDSPVKESYVTVNARAAWQATGNIELFIRGENLTGSSYSTMYGFPMPGATVYGGMGISL